MTIVTSACTGTGEKIGSIAGEDLVTDEGNVAFAYDNDLMSRSELRLQGGIGRLIAIEGKVSTVHEDVFGKPFFELSDTNAPGRSVQVGTVSEKFRDWIDEEARLRVMGFILKAANSERPLNPDIEHIVIAVCLLHSGSLVYAFDSRYIDQCEAWRSGRLEDEPVITSRLSAKTEDGL